MNTLVGTKLKTLRQNKGYSQEFVADSLHMSQSAYARMENGKSNSWATHITQICELYEIKPEELLKQDTNTFNQTNTEGNNNGIVINQISEKLIEQYELRIKEKNQQILELKNELKRYKE